MTDRRVAALICLVTILGTAALAWSEEPDTSGRPSKSAEAAPAALCGSWIQDWETFRQRFVGEHVTMQYDRYDKMGPDKDEALKKIGFMDVVSNAAKFAKMRFKSPYRITLSSDWTATLASGDVTHSGTWSVTSEWKGRPDSITIHITHTGDARTSAVSPLPLLFEGSALRGREVDLGTMGNVFVREK